MAKTYRNRKNIWEDGQKAKRPKPSSKLSKKKKYTTHEIMEKGDIDYEYIQ